MGSSSRLGESAGSYFVSEAVHEVQSVPVDEEADEWLSPDDVLAVFDERVRKGYNPLTVDAHLSLMAQGVAALRREMAIVREAATLTAEERSVFDAELTAQRNETALETERLIAEAKNTVVRLESDARFERQQLLLEAERQAFEIVNRAQVENADLDARARGIERSISELADEHQRVTDELRALASRIELVAEHSADAALGPTARAGRNVVWADDGRTPLEKTVLDIPELQPVVVANQRDELFDRIEDLDHPSTTSPEPGGGN